MRVLKLADFNKKEQFLNIVVYKDKHASEN